MGCSRPAPPGERHDRRIGGFSAPDESCREKCTDVGDSDNTGRAGQKMLVNNASTTPSRIVEVIIRRENFGTSSYMLDSMTQKKCRRVTNEVQEFVLASGQRVDDDGYYYLRAGRPRQRTSRRNEETKAVNEDQRRQHSVGSDFSSEVDIKLENDGGSQSRRRKRACRGALQESRHESLEPLVSETIIPLMIGDEEKVISFYRQILKDGQQTLCKKLAKWWIRAINPNKQSTYPYAKGSATAPPWWPPTPPKNAQGDDCKGTTENGLVRHREPDHLAKPERLTLLPYILNKVTEPRNRKLFHGVDVAKLQQISIESINNEGPDRNRHSSWRSFVNEMFRVALMQERFKSSCIDGTTAVNVLQSYDQLRPIGTGSTDEVDEDKDSEDDIVNKHTPTPGSSPDRETHALDRPEPRLLEQDIKPRYPSYVHGNSSQLTFPGGMNTPLSCGGFNSTSNPLASQLPRGVQTVPLLRSNHVSNTMMQEPLRRPSDISDRLLAQHSYTFESYPLQPCFQLPPVPESPIGHILAPLSTLMARQVANIPQVSNFQDTAMYSLSNAPYPAPMGDHVLQSHGNLRHAPPSFQDFLNN